MPITNWKRELFKVALSFGIVAILCIVLELGIWPLFFTAVAVCGWLLWQLQRLDVWLRDGAGTEPPEAVGMWGRVFDTIYDMQRNSTVERERLLATLDYLRASFASMSDAVVMIDSGGDIEWCNTAAAELLGLRPGEDHGRQLTNLMRSPTFLRYFEGENYERPLEMASPVNADIQLSVSLSFFARRNRLLFARDVSRTFRLEQMRKDFVANVSHELRTPLTVINGYLETFSEHSGDNPVWDRAVDQMLQQSRRMHNLIQDLLLLSRLETVPSDRARETIQLQPMMEMIREEVITAAKGVRKVEIECDSNLALCGQSGELRSAFSNLAVNAARYTHDGDRITLRWYSDAQNAYFEVEDSGIGIEPQYIPRLTERFYRVDQSRSLDTGGTGLGLAIVKHVLLRHRARLDISSVPGKGSTFCCVFPLSSTLRNDSANAS